MRARQPPNRRALYPYVFPARTGVGRLPDDSFAAMAKWLAPLIGWARHAAWETELIDGILAAAQTRRAMERSAALTYTGR